MDVTADLQKLREKAESYYMAGDFCCSETVLKVIFEDFDTELPENIVSLASAFRSGVGGSGCICGALVGGAMALGMFFGRGTAKEEDNVKKAMELSNELHNLFKKKHKVPCCRVLTKGVTRGSPEQKQQCARFVGDVAEETAKIIIREKGATILKRL
jgi:C_GCAxxG_C_C family probable redox protein